MMKIKPVLLLCTLFVLLVSCKKTNEESVVTFSGNLKNLNIDSVYVLLNGREKAFALDSDGNFSDTIHLKRDGYYIFSDSRNELPIYLKANDNLSINVDYHDFDNSLKFAGVGEAENNYLFKKENRVSEILTDEQSFYSKPSHEYREILKSYEKQFLLELEKQESKLDDTFVKAEKKNIHYDYLYYLYSYKDAYAYFNNQPPELSDEFTKDIENIDLNNEEDFEFYPTYRNMVNYIIQDQLQEVSLEDVVKKIKSNKIKDQFLLSLLPNINPNSSDSLKTYQVILKNTENEKILELAKNAMEKIQKTANIKVANFSYPDAKDKMISLSDFQGKLVYIDLWATWCKPCFMEFPYLKKIVEEYKNQNIAFIGISLDEEKAKNKWLSTLKEQQFTIPQVFAGAENLAKDPFLGKLNITYIPRFVLIGKDGKLISSEAPSPSNPMLKKLIEENL